MCSFWEKGSLPADEERLARLVDVSVDEFRMLWSNIKSFFEENEGGGLQHIELAAEREELLERRRQRSEAGKKGAWVRWQDHGGAGSADGDANGPAGDGPNGGAMASSKGRGQKTEGSGSHLRGTEDRREGEGAKGTQEVPCPECGEILVAPGTERCSRCELLAEIE